MIKLNFKKICVVTGTRAEYGLLYWILKSIKNSKNLDLNLVVTGMHLSEYFGLTYKEILNDGFDINHKLNLELKSDKSRDINKSISIGINKFSNLYEKIKPDLLLVLGDRFEIFSAVSAAMISRVPVAHCHGGELTEGLFDDPIRHSITKMSHIHFCSSSIYKKRIIQMGEQPNTVYNVGAFGIENINNLNLLSKDQFEKSVSFSLNNKFLLIVTYHPVTLEESTAETQIDNLLKALDRIKNCNIIFTKSNSDTDGRIINDKIDDYVLKHHKISKSFISMGQIRYLSAIKHADCVIGNSSSGIIEAPYFKTPTINIGDRQRGRITPNTVINSGNSIEEIFNSINLSLTKSFKKSCENNFEYPFGDGNVSKKVIKVLEQVDTKYILKKKFYDL